MSIRDLDSIFAPQRVAVVGASEDPDKVGARVLANLAGSGFGGEVYPVNARREQVQGLRAYPSITALPEVPDLVVVCTPAATVIDVVQECGDRGVGGVIVVSAGFAEVGDEGRGLQRQLAETAARYEDMRVIGPNCLGVLVPGAGLNASFAGALPPRGRLAFISQSGAVCTAVLDWARGRGIGFSHFVSLGNMADVGFAALIDYFGQSPDVDAILLYIESITDAREFMSAARAFARRKPIVAYKAGRFAQSAAAAASHTGAMAGDDDAFDAAARRAGVERVFEMEDMFDCAQLLAHERLPRGPRLAIVTNAGGPGVMAVDSLLARSGSLAELSRETLTALDGILPPAWSHGNPVDILGDAPPQRYADAIAPVLADRGVDAVLVVLSPQAMTDPTECARALARYAQQTRKPLLASWMGGEAVAAGREVLQETGIPVYETPEGAIEAFTHLVSYARNLETLYETPRDILPEAWAAPRRLEGWPPEPGTDGVVGERESKRLLRAYGIRCVMPERAGSPEAAVRVARSMGYPVVVKVDSPDISHKTDVGGVVLDVRGDDAVRRVYSEIVSSAAEHRPGARVDGVFVEPMVRATDGIELILGCKRDATFGAIVLVGLGGVSAELFRDFALELPPVNERLARRLLESLRAWPLLRGYRDRPGIDVDALVEAIVRFSYLVAEHPEVTEIDVNPLLATPRGVTALDARMVLRPEGLAAPAYSHLAIRPYPEHYVHEDYLRDGTPVTYRPIKPEDEPMWHRLLSSCSEDSIRARFFSVIKEFTHEIASRFCFIDYEREMAIVAEVETAGRRELIAVGRLVADPDHEAAEFAILIGDDWQGLGLGSKLTAYCLQVAEQWGIDWIYATTLKGNVRMLAIFEEHGFTTRPDPEEGVVDAMRPLRAGTGKEPPPWQRVLKERAAVS